MTTQRFNVCSGDADGLSAALQWRLHEPLPATLLTGLKREISLLERVHANARDEVNVFDLSMQRNRSALLGLLGAGAHVRYFDHHEVRDIPSHPLLELQVDCASDVCTCLLVDRRIGGAFRAWALVGAQGDNLAGVADRLAIDSGIGSDDRLRLRRLGEAINYNAYGDAMREYDDRPCSRRQYQIAFQACGPIRTRFGASIVDLCMPARPRVPRTVDFRYAREAFAGGCEFATVR